MQLIKTLVRMILNVFVQKKRNTLLGKQVPEIVLILTTDKSPFKKCTYSADPNGKVRCKIKNEGDYYYEVNVEGCATNPYDPRIVVQ